MMQSDDRAEGALEELGERARARWEHDTTRALDQLHEDPDALSEAHSEAVTQAVLERLGGSSNVEPLRPRRGMAVLVAVLSIAAALTLWFAITSRTTTEPAPLIVRYEGTFEGGDHATRTADPKAHDPSRDPSKPTQLRGASSLTWTLVPATAVSSAMSVRIEARSASQTRCIELAAEHLTQHDTGALVIEGEAGAVLGLSPGTWALHALVAPPKAFEAMDDPCASSERDARGIVVAGSQDVLLVP